MFCFLNLSITYVFILLYISSFSNKSQKVFLIWKDNQHYYIFTVFFFTLYSEIVLDLENNCKSSTKRLYALALMLSNTSNSHNQSTMTKTRRSTLAHNFKLNYRPYSKYPSFSTKILFLLQVLTLPLVVSSHQFSHQWQFLSLSLSLMTDILEENWSVISYTVSQF